MRRLIGKTLRAVRCTRSAAWWLNEASALKELTDRIREQAVFDLGDVDVAKVIDQVAPWIVQPADPRDKRDHATDLEPASPIYA